LTRIPLVLLVGVLLAAPGLAAAHSLLLESTPAAGATLPAGPHPVSLRFNNRIEKRLSRLRVLDERGGERPVVVDAAAGEADRLVGALPALPPGSYRLQWQVLSTDGHIVSGSFTFRLVP
jgi:methionine-rich copper-binding protein CopC